MRSTLKTTAAVLRAITEERDLAVWANHLGKSVHTIRHLEAGSLKLSAATAGKMNYETGISIKWLMDVKPAAPPITPNGREYTKEIYDKVRARKKYFATVKDENVRSTVLDVLGVICRVLVSANRNRNFHLAVYRTAKALAELRAEFGEAKDFDGIDTVLRYVRQPYEPPPEDVQEGLRRVQQMIRDGTLPKVEDLSCLPDKQPTSKPKSKQLLKKRRR